MKFMTMNPKLFSVDTNIRRGSNCSFRTMYYKKKSIDKKYITIPAGMNRTGFGQYNKPLVGVNRLVSEHFRAFDAEMTRALAFDTEFPYMCVLMEDDEYGNQIAIKVDKKKLHCVEVDEDGETMKLDKVPDIKGRKVGFIVKMYITRSSSGKTGPATRVTLKAVAMKLYPAGEEEEENRVFEFDDNDYTDETKVDDDDSNDDPNETHDDANPGIRDGDLLVGADSEHDTAAANAEVADAAVANNLKRAGASIESRPAKKTKTQQ